MKQLTFEDILLQDLAEFRITYYDDRGVKHQDPVIFNRHFLGDLGEWRKNNRDKHFNCIEFIKNMEADE